VREEELAMMLLLIAIVKEYPLSFLVHNIASPSLGESYVQCLLSDEASPLSVQQRSVGHCITNSTEESIGREVHSN